MTESVEVVDKCTGLIMRKQKLPSSNEEANQSDTGRNVIANAVMGKSVVIECNKHGTELTSIKVGRNYI